MQYLIAFCSRPEATSDVMSGIFVDPSRADPYEGLFLIWSFKVKPFSRYTYTTASLCDERRRRQQRCRRTPVITSGQHASWRSKLTKMPSPTTWRRISRERFNPAVRNFTAISGTTRPRNARYTTSLAALGRLQNVIEYSIKVRKTGPSGK